MPRKVVDFSARSELIRAEPFMLHFWESTPTEMLAFIRDPRGQLREMGIELPPDCRIETTIENHDWLADRSANLSADNGTIVCNTGGGNVAKNYYKVSFYAHDESAVGKHEKRLLHRPEEQERVGE